MARVFRNTHRAFFKPAELPVERGAAGLVSLVLVEVDKRHTVRRNSFSFPRCNEEPLLAPLRHARRRLTQTVSRQGVVGDGIYFGFKRH